MINKVFWQNKRVFLTGATGFKGAWLSLWLSEMGASVTGYSLEPGTDPNLFTLARIDEKINHQVGDICDIEILRKSMAQASPDIVIHMAAQALVRESYHEPILTYQTNIIGTANVLECVRKCLTVKTVLVITTDKCYENKEWCWGYREHDSLGGYDPYSSSKACAEFVTATYRQSFLREAGIAVATVRAGNVIGGGDWAKDRLIPDCIKAIERKERIIIRSPWAIRPWQHVLEPLHGYLMLAEKLYTEGNQWAESWNFGPDEDSCVCVGDVTKSICHLLAGEYEVKLDSACHEAHYLKLDCAKARQRLHWQPVLSLDMALSYTVDWYHAYWRGEDVREITLKQIVAYQSNLL